MEKQFDEIALPVQLGIDAPRGGSLCARRDDRLDVAELQLLQNCVRVVAAVGEACVARDEIDQFVCDGAIVLLARRNDDFEGPSL